MPVYHLLRLVLVAAALAGTLTAHAQSVGFSGGIGPGVSAERGGQIAVEVSVDWWPSSLVVSGRAVALTELLGDSEAEFALLVGPAWKWGRWSASAGVGGGLVWYEDRPGFLSDRRPTEVRGPFVSLPLSAEVAYRIVGPVHVRARGIGSVNGVEGFWGATIGSRFRF